VRLCLIPAFPGNTGHASTHRSLALKVLLRVRRGVGNGSGHAVPVFGMSRLGGFSPHTFGRAIQARKAMIPVCD